MFIPFPLSPKQGGWTALDLSTDKGHDECSNLLIKAGARRGGAPPPPTGASVVAQCNAKKAALDEFARDNNLKPESIKKAYKRFQATDKDKSGMIDYTEFCEILQVDPSPQGEKVFQLFDYDKSGQIDVREFMIALSNFTGAGKDDKLKFSFMIFDEDGNGVITKDELTRILKVRQLPRGMRSTPRPSTNEPTLSSALPNRRITWPLKIQKSPGRPTPSCHRQTKMATVRCRAHPPALTHSNVKITAYVHTLAGVVTFDEFVIVSKKFPNILVSMVT